jgi:apolipoprotein N-acyltransferase
VAAGIGGALYAAAMPGFDFAEATWFWAVPFVLWAAARPAWKTWLRAAFAAMWLASIVTLVWLRHVYPPLGWLGLVLLTATVALFPVAWLALLRWLFPKTQGAPLMARVVIQLGLAGAWVLLEWVRSWVLTGFPWLLLAETQWRRPAVLAICQWGGPWAVGFAAILFNVGVAAYILRILKNRELAEEARYKTRRKTPPAGEHTLAAPADRAAAAPAAGFADGTALAAITPSGLFGKICPEFYLGFLPVFFAFHTFVQTSGYLRGNAEKLFTVAVVQTDFDPNAKWDAALAHENAAVVRDLTLAAARLTAGNPVFDARIGNAVANPAAPVAIGIPAAPAATPAAPPDLILWPEAALPFPVGDPLYDRFLDLRKLAADAGATLLAGGIVHEDGGYSNAIFTVTGAAGLGREIYAKRHLVPFGEYVPLGNILPLRRVVPIARDCLVGQFDDPLSVRLPGGGAPLKAGALVCYEDVFPDLALDLARRGADFFAVLTNDAWYGREAGAYQHAAHSAVLAASLRLPVVRCGNNGWSGVIFPDGSQQALRDAVGSVYFRGAGRFEVRGVRAALRVPTFYQQHGNWLVTCSGLLLLWAVLRNRRWKRDGNAK